MKIWIYARVSTLDKQDLDTQLIPLITLMNYELILKIFQKLEKVKWLNHSLNI